METKVCTGCNETKTLDDFVRQKRTNSKGDTYYARTSKCKKCHTKNTNAWKKANKATYNSYKRLWRIKNKDSEWARGIQYRYKVTEADYKRMLGSQGGACAICKCKENIFRGRSIYFCVDHDHATGKVRGLLCSACNRALGLFKDDTSIIKSSLDYLTRHKNEDSIRSNTAGATVKGIECLAG